MTEKSDRENKRHAERDTLEEIESGVQPKERENIFFKGQIE